MGTLSHQACIRFSYLLLLYLQPPFRRETRPLMASLLLLMVLNQDLTDLHRNMIPPPFHINLHLPLINQHLPLTSQPQSHISLPLCTRRRKRTMLPSPTSTSTEYKTTTPTQPSPSLSHRMKSAP